MKKTMTLQETYQDHDLPREKLVRMGPETLTDPELLAIILRTGTRKKNVVALSLEILNHFGDLYNLRNASLVELQSFDGIGEHKAVSLQATLELGYRMSLAKQERGVAITSTSQAGQFFQNRMKSYVQEHIVALYLDTKNRIIKKETVFKGTLNQSVAHPREIFYHAVKNAAARVILAHNHPSGNPTPSQADISFTQRLIEAGDIVGIEVLDHFIIGDDSYLSMKEAGII